MGALSGETEMAKQVVRYETYDGKFFDNLAEAERYEAVTRLSAELDAFDGKFEGDEFDTMGAATWLLKTYKLERK